MNFEDLSIYFWTVIMNHLQSSLKNNKKDICEFLQKLFTNHLRIICESFADNVQTHFKNNEKVICESFVNCLQKLDDDCPKIFADTVQTMFMTHLQIVCESFADIVQTCCRHCPRIICNHHSKIMRRMSHSFKHNWIS